MSISETVSLSSLADQVGVSQATVSRVLNNREGIGTKTRRRVLEAARQSGYRPRVAVRKTTAALVIDHADESRITGAGFPEALTMRVVEALARHRLVIETFTAGNLDALPDRFVDGVLAIAWTSETIRTLQGLDGVPVVIFNRPEYTGFSNIQIDDRQIGRLAAQQFLEHGHRRLGMLAQKMDREASERLAGYREVLTDAGIEMPETAVALAEVLSPYSAVRRLINEGVTGLFVSCEHLAIEVPFLCHELLDIDLPSQLSVIGVGLETAMKYHCPPVTLIAPPVEQMAGLGVEVLGELIAARETGPRNQKVMPKLVARASVGPPRVD